MNTSPNTSNPLPKAYHHLSVNASLMLPKFHDITLEYTSVPLLTGSGPLVANTLQIQFGRSFLVDVTVPF